MRGSNLPAIILEEKSRWQRGSASRNLHFVASQVAMFLIYTCSEKWSNYSKVLVGRKLLCLI